MRNKKFTLVVVLVLLSRFSFGQGIASYLNPLQEYEKAVWLFDQKKYQAAMQYFEQIIAESDNYPVHVVEESYYRNALCAIELLHSDAEFKANIFIGKYPESAKVNQVRFETGRFHYRKKDFSNALQWFEGVKPASLHKSDREEYFFSGGYCYFMNDSLDKARMMFFEIKDNKSSYGASALYYYSHINYEESNYQTALDGFLKLRNDSTFAPIVPYYICHIYFMQQRYKEVIDYAAQSLQHVTERRKGEVARIIAESHFYLKQYTEAIPYYEIYLESGVDLSEEDYYQSGYSLYKAEEYQKAALQFEKISNSASLLGQNASYHLADCYIRLGNKQKAMIAFTNAAATSFDPKIKEDAMFNAAILNYELSISPFSEAIRTLEEYIATYPQSARIDEAYNYLVLAYMNTRNYDFAFRSIQKIAQPNDQVKQAIQHIAFFRGIELVTNAQYNEAIEKFNVAIQHSAFDRRIAALARYWKGECLYRTGKYADAAGLFNEFTLAQGTFQMEEYKTAHYNLGYSYFKLKKYSEALTWFRKFIGLSGHKDKTMLADANNRAADIFFLQADYTNAIRFYNDAALLNSVGADYALFQKGFSYGLMANYEAKITALEELMRLYPTSSYADNALFETALSYQAINELKKAETVLNRLVSQYPQSRFMRGALVQLGLIYYNTAEYDKAIASYKKVVSGYPGTSEANSALNGLKNIYIEQNRVEAYLSYVDQLGGTARITGTEKDSLLFANAESIYFKGNCDNAVVKLNEYIAQAANPMFTKRATVYLADCYARQGRVANALEAYNKVIAMPGNDYREEALLEASRINYTAAAYDRALANYLELEKVAQSADNRLEAQIGKLRCYYKTANYRQAAEAANDIINNSRAVATFQRESRFLQASSYFQLKDYGLALPGFEQIAGNLKTREGAESKYHIARIYFIQGNQNKAEEVVYEFIKINSPHQFWVARSYLLLAEILIKKNDLFQATHTVKSILDYYDNKTDGILDEAKEIKKRIDELESQKGRTGKELEISIDN